MKRLSILLLAAVAALSFAASAGAKTPANVRTYGELDYPSENIRVTIGQVFSGKRECFSNRRFVFSVAAKGGGLKPIDTGKTSLDGAIAGGYDNDFVKDRDVYFTLAKTKRCAGKTVKATPPEEMSARKVAKPVGSVVLLLGLDSFGSDGVFGGLVGLEKRAKCFYNRKMKLLGGGEVLDRGTTTFGGAFGLHITEGEFFGSDKLVFKVAKSKLKDGTVCGAAKTTYTPMTT